MKLKVGVFVVLVLFPAFLWSQSVAPFSISVTPSALIPMGPLNTDGSALYSIGGSATIDGDFIVPGLQFLLARGTFDYSYVPIAGIQSQLSILSLGVGPGVRFTLFPRFEVRLGGYGGYSLLVRPTLIGWNPCFGAELSASYALAQNFTLGAGASYRYVVNTFNGFGLSITASIGFGQGPQKPNMKFKWDFDPVFPVFYKYYDDHAAGRLIMENGESGTIRGVKVSFLVPQYMAGPKECASFSEMQAGEKKDVPIYALFTDAIIGITEDTKVNARFMVEYSYMDASLNGETDLSLPIFNRNAMSWDDDRKAAAFVTSKDPSLLKFSKAVASQARDGSAAINAKFREAMGLFQALGVYGVRYVSDPASSYAVNSKNKSVIDYLQFPTQTLTYKAGDCDDLSILYAAMNEAVGTETAFITIPGHIFIAFCPDIDPSDIRTSFARPDDFIVKNDKSWIPIEITMIQDGFLSAWKAGIKEWREANDAGQAGFFPTEESWKLYGSAPFIGVESMSEGLKADETVKAFSQELSRFIEGEIKSRESALKIEIAAKKNDPRPLNSLGVLYARYGLYDKAEAELSKAAKMDYTPALVNLGNLALLSHDPRKARAYLERAYEKEPNSVAVIVGLAKVRYEEENVEAVQSLYDKLKALDTKTAVKFSYLVSKSSEQARASSADAGPVVWSEIQ